MRPPTCNSASYNSYGTSDTLSSRTSTCSFYSSYSYSDDEWDEASDSGSSGDDIMGSYKRRLSEESRKRLMRKLNSVRYNPNHHMRRVVPVGDRSSIDGGVPNPLEVSVYVVYMRGLRLKVPLRWEGMYIYIHQLGLAW